MSSDILADSVRPFAEHPTDLYPIGAAQRLHNPVKRRSDRNRFGHCWTQYSATLAARSSDEFRRALSDDLRCHVGVVIFLAAIEQQRCHGKSHEDYTRITKNQVNIRKAGRLATLS